MYTYVTIAVKSSRVKNSWRVLMWMEEWWGSLHSRSFSCCAVSICVKERSLHFHTHTVANRTKEKQHRECHVRFLKRGGPPTIPLPVLSKMKVQMIFVDTGASQEAQKVHPPSSSSSSSYGQSFNASMLGLPSNIYHTHIVKSYTIASSRHGNSHEMNENAGLVLHLPPQ